MDAKQAGIAVTIIGGYLGSGKTTLLNHLLQHADGARLAIMVNDFGDLAIDAALIESQQGDVINLSGGCVCCSYGDDLSLSLQKLVSQEIKPDHVIIEASGVALPGAIGRSLSLQRAYRLEGIVVVADASTVQANASEKYIGDTVSRQLYDADLLVLNKLDLLPTAEVESLKQWLAEQSRYASIIEAVHCSVPSSLLFNMSLVNVPDSWPDSWPDKRPDKRHDTRLAMPADSLVGIEPNNHDVSVYVSLSIKPSFAMNAHALAEQLAHKRLALIRAKGFVRDTNNQLKTIQVVGRRWSVTDAPEGAQPGMVCIAQKNDMTEHAIKALFSADAAISI